MLQTKTQADESENASAKPKSRFMRFIKDPLLHFILAGAGVYLLFGLFGEAESTEEIEDQNTIVITQGEVEWLSDTWRQRWNRPPTEQELNGLVKQYLRETVLYREAMSMGLDKDDTIIRRRLAQKLEFLANDLIQPETPSDEELKQYFEDNVDKYQAPELVTFTHVFLDPDKRENATLDDAEQLKSQLIDENKDPADIRGVGDPFMLQRYYPERPESEVGKLFGREFARNVMELEPDKWHGPVLSGYGVHLVYVQGVREFPVPTFEQVAGQVSEDLMNDQRVRMNDEYIDSLLARYTVVIEGQGDDADGGEDDE